MDIDIFSLKYLQFIFSNLWVWIGFLIFLLIITNATGRLFAPVKEYFLKVRKKIKDYDKKEKVWDKIKEAQPLITKK